MEPWIKNQQSQKDKIIKYLDDPFFNGMILGFLKELNQIKLEEFGNFDKRIKDVKRDLFLIGKECGSDVLFNLIGEVFEELGKTTEERFLELGDINEILKEDKPTKKSSTEYTGKITISQLAKKRYGIETDSQNRCACPLHGGTNKTSFVFYDDINSFKCYSCGSKGSMLLFVKLMEEQNDRS